MVRLPMHSRNLGTTCAYVRSAQLPDLCGSCLCADEIVRLYWVIDQPGV